MDFYEDERRLAKSVAAYLADGLRAGEALVVIATEDHRALIARALDAHRIGRRGGVEDSRAEVWLDAGSALAWFEHDGRIDREAARTLLAGVVRSAGGDHDGTRVYGEIVALAWDAGHVQAAIELEEVWNELKAELPFSLYCGYPAASVAGPEHADDRERVSALHTAAVHEPERRTGAGWPRSEVSGDFQAESEAPRRARGLVRDALVEWGVAERRIEAADLVVSELATNAVLHVVSPFSVTARIDGWSLRLEVRDGGRASSLTAERLVAHPRNGLGIVEAICARWGYTAVVAGKVVWAEIALGDADRAPVA